MSTHRSTSAIRQLQALLTDAGFGEPDPAAPHGWRCYPGHEHDAANLGERLLDPVRTPPDLV